MEKTQTHLVLWYASSDTFDVYKIERFVCERKTFEAVRVNDESGIWTRSLSLERRTRSGWRDTTSRPAFQCLAASTTHTPFPEPISNILLRGTSGGGLFQDGGNTCQVKEPPLIWRARRVSTASLDRYEWESRKEMATYRSRTFRS